MSYKTRVLVKLSLSMLEPSRNENVVGLNNDRYFISLTFTSWIDLLFVKTELPASKNRPRLNMIVVTIIARSYIYDHL